MDYQILQALTDDVEEILTLQKLAYQIEAKRYNNYDIQPLKQTREELKNQFKDHIFLKAVWKKKIVGTVRAYENNGTCFIGRLAVQPDMQNKGIGAALMEEIEKYYTSKSYELFVGSKSYNNIHLYKKLGYAIYKTDVYECGDIEIFYMEKGISSSTKRTANLDQGWEIRDPFYSDIYNRAKHLLRTRQNTLHTRISYHFALTLLEAEGGNPQLVLPAIILHDIGYSQLPEGEIKESFGPKITKPELQRLHEVEGVRLAGEILRDMDYPPNMIQSIQSYIDGHDTRETVFDINDIIVRDADKLWRYSYEGFLLNFQWFDLTPQAYMDRLKSKIPTWFFSKTAKISAAKKAEKREKDMKLLK